MEQDRLALTASMHRRAGLLGLSGTPKLSSIDKRWFMEVNNQVTDESGRYMHTVFNIALGTGDTPIEAAADGYAQCNPEMAFYPLLARLEAVVPKLLARARAMKRLDAALADLTDMVRSVNVPRAAAPGEDDDL